MTPFPILKTVTLDQISVVAQSTVDAQMLKHCSASERMQLLANEDAYARRQILRCFGRTAKITMECPATWWQHLKLALRSAWPRIFGRLRVRQRRLELETGAVIADLPNQVRARYAVIPYVSPEALEP